jgi:hypothetical protein
MNDTGMNGKPNPARPFSIMAIVILCLSLMIFFIKFAKSYSNNALWRPIIKTCGILSMVSAIFIFTKYHDLMTVISSVFGFFVVIGIIKGLYKSELLLFKISGLICIILLGLNNYVYYSRHFIDHLPLLQKITFAIVLMWIIGLNDEMNKDKESRPQYFT